MTIDRETIGVVLVPSAANRELDNAHRQANEILGTVCDAYVEPLKDNILSYAKILRDGTNKVSDYLNAVKFITLKNADFTTREAWEATFPDRYTRMVTEGRSEKHINSAATMYARTALVAKLLEISQKPLWVFHAGYANEALEKAYELMTDSTSTKFIQLQAASLILDKVQVTEAQKIDVEVTTNDASLELIMDAAKRIDEQSYNDMVKGKLPLQTAAKAKNVGQLVIEGEIVK